MSDDGTRLRQVIDTFMRSLPIKDWDAMRETLAHDVRRSGPDSDVVVGVEPYMKWLADMADPLHQYGWDNRRYIWGDDGRSAVVESQTEYLLTKDSEPFGYHLIMWFVVNDDFRIVDVDLYWKSPERRLRGGVYYEVK